VCDEAGNCDCCGCCLCDMDKNCWCCGSCDCRKPVGPVGTEGPGQPMVLLSGAGGVVGGLPGGESPVYYVPEYGTPPTYGKSAEGEFRA
jgi:hypothetical protein